MCHAPDQDRPDLPLHFLEKQRYDWQTHWGVILIEVLGEQVWVDGQLVEPASAVSSVFTAD